MIKLPDGVKRIPATSERGIRCGVDLRALITPENFAHVYPFVNELVNEIVSMGDRESNVLDVMCVLLERGIWNPARR